MKITFITHKFPHHGINSGYDILSKYIKNFPFEETAVTKRLKKIDIKKFEELPFFLNHKTRGFYFPLEFSLGVNYSNVDEDSFLSEDNNKVVKNVFDLIINNRFKEKNKDFNKNEKHIFHFLYSHLSFRYFKHFPLNNNIKIVLTIHEPPELIESWDYKEDIFRKVDAIILMSNTQKNYVEELSGKNNVFVIPHGINTEFFYPLENKKENKIFTTLFVGHYIRDILTLVKTIKSLKEKNIKCKHRILTFKEHFHNFKELDNVELFLGISDDELKSLYQSSDCLLLPLLNATANNTILEAMACGLPIVSTNIGGINEYVNIKCSFLEKKGDYEALAERIIQLKENPSLSKQMGAESRKRALDFQWPKIAEMTKRVYEKI